MGVCLPNAALRLILCRTIYRSLDKARKRDQTSSEEASEEPGTSVTSSSGLPAAVPASIWKDQFSH
ncbi:hypothetical protein T09_233 [Trichinella sp. T9]|nr:hypothetical protein T09_233 [Trichinella sp. T9]